MSENNEKQLQNSKQDGQFLSDLLQRAKDFYRRAQSFDPSSYQQAYLRIFSWTSFLLVLAIFLFGIWAGFSLGTLKEDIELSQIKQSETDFLFSDLISDFQDTTNQLRQEYNNEQISLATIDDFQLIIDEISRVKVNSLQEKSLIDQSIASNLILVQRASSIFLAAMIGLIALMFVNLVLVTWSDFRVRRELRTLRNEWMEKGVKTGILKTTETLDLDPSVLRNIMSWMYNYGHNQKDADEAFNLFTQLIARFSFLNFHPAGNIGEEVVFDPLLHRNIESDIKPGDIGYISETGWILDNELIRKPLVVRRGV